MDKVELIRIESGLSGTFGVVRINGEAFCVSLELPWKDNQKNISCIPAGTYTCKRRYSAKHKTYLYGVQNVPGRGDIEIHVGNTIADILGCILLGQSYGTYKGKRCILSSGGAITEFMDKMAGKPFTLIIKEVFS